MSSPDATHFQAYILITCIESMYIVPLSERPYIALKQKEVAFYRTFHTCSVIETSQRYLKLLHEGPWYTDENEALRACTLPGVSLPPS